MGADPPGQASVFGWSTTSRRSSRSSLATSSGRDTKLHVARDGYEAMALVASKRPDLVVLDVMLPGADGMEVMQRLRDGDGDRVAVILLTAKGEESDRVLGLRLGADSFVVKPFSPAELVARVDAVLRRLEPVPDRSEPLRFDGLEIDPGARRVLVWDEEAQLAQREFDLLLFMARHPGQVFTRDQLMDAVWELPLLQRHLDRDRPHPPAARQDRSRSNRAAANPDRVGDRLRVGAMRRSLRLPARRGTRSCLARRSGPPTAPRSGPRPAPCWFRSAPSRSASPMRLSAAAAASAG